MVGGERGIWLDWWSESKILGACPAKHGGGTGGGGRERGERPGILKWRDRKSWRWRRDKDNFWIPKSEKGQYGPPSVPHENLPKKLKIEIVC